MHVNFRRFLELFDSYCRPITTPIVNFFVPCFPICILNSRFVFPPVMSIASITLHVLAFYLVSLTRSSFIAKLQHTSPKLIYMIHPFLILSLRLYLYIYFCNESCGLVGTFHRTFDDGHHNQGVLKVIYLGSRSTEWACFNIKNNKLCS